ncbi:MAG: GNAT family N-acetyltransferase [Verrucomicrobiae bacterium]|nr:GNAT family N-acetyltransferase [Verrucomicrobiae bacterium]
MSNGRHTQTKSALQLQMVWPGITQEPPRIPEVAAGYVLRLFKPAEKILHERLMISAGFSDWTAARLQEVLGRALPGGFFVVEHTQTGALVATAMATHNPTDLHPFGGELGWVACDPAHRRKGLGTAVCGAVTRLFLALGYTDIYLRTDDWRLPAIAMYLKLGYVPLLFAPEMEHRWMTVFEQLGRPWDRKSAVVWRKTPG